MARKSKKHGKRRHLAGLFQQAQRQTAKGNFRQALKDAKVWYRQQPSEERRRFLESAYLARARELYRAGMYAECRAVVESLTDFGVTDPSVQQELPELLVCVGLPQRNNVDWNGLAPETRSRLLFRAADHAVVRYDAVPIPLPEIREGALCIRTALEALAAGDESAALEAVRNVARNSPFADWKYFVRGLAAYYRQDTDEMLANWDRLDAARSAARIAATLKASAESLPAGQHDGGLRTAVRQMEKGVLGEPVLARLEDLCGHLAADRWEKVLETLRQSRDTFRRFDPSLPHRVTEVLVALIVRKDLQFRLSQLARVASPPPMDPRWNRAWALIWEPRDIEEAEQFWLRYLEDLKTLPALSAAERPLAQALVWVRIGQLFVAELAAPPLFSQPPKRMRPRAVKCFRNALKLSPRLLPAYQTLAAAYQAWNQPAKAADAYRQLTKHFPENLEALLFLARYHHQREEPLEGREYALRAYRLKPLDEAIAVLAWSTLVAAARHYADQQNWAEGRAELEAAAGLPVSARKASELLVHKGLFELKAGEADLGRRLIEQAKGQSDGPASVLLSLAAEARRYELAKALCEDFDRQWLAALKTKCRGQAIGHMCAVLREYLTAQIEYPGRSDHLKHLVSCLRHHRSAEYQADDLRRICRFLELRPNETRLLDHFVDQGRKSFPQCPYFHFAAGEREAHKHPRARNLQTARACFERALELAKESSDPEDAALVEKAKQHLTFLGELSKRFRPPFAATPDPDDEPQHSCFGPSPEELCDMFEEICATMGLDPDEIVDEVFPGAPRTARKKRSPRETASSNWGER